MATVDKKYLDLEGLKTYNTKVKKLIDDKVAKETGTELHNLGAYKIATNKDGLVTETAALSYDDLQGKPTIGAGNLTLQLNGKDIGSFNANAESNSTINIKFDPGDLGLTNAMVFRGVSIKDPLGAEGAEIEGEEKPASVTFKAGDVVLYSTKEYVYNGKKWIELGDEGSHALKTIEITGTDGLTGGGNLTENRTISHAAPAGAAVTDIGAYAIATDKFGHVTQTRALSVSADEVPNHKHTVSASGTVAVPAISATSNKKLSVTVEDKDFLTGVTPVVSKLETVSIIPAKSNGTVTPAVAVEEANRPTKTVYSPVTASKATAGSPITYGTANRAAEATIVGNANKATVATTVGNANVGDAAKVAVSATVTGKNAYDVSYDDATECLSFTALSLETAPIAQAVASSTSIYGAVDSSTSIYGAETSENTFTPYTFADVTASNITSNAAVDVAKAGTAVNVATVDTAVTVATGRLSTTAAGDSILTGVTPASAKAVTAASIVDTGSTGVAFVSAIKVGTTDKKVSVSGETYEAGKHTPTVSI
ncbi:hypothetical protein, partial [Intestinibacter sp.]|uniref:hypothetical protein n=1 Tax=Intestinibacter sp. TaxID=1965304 RepID=UPI002A763B84